MGAIKHLLWHLLPPKEVLLPPFRSPEAYHSDFVCQAGREMGVNAAAPTSGISGGGAEKFAEQEQQEE